MVDAPAAAGTIEPVFAELSATGEADLVNEGVAPGQIRIERFLDLRYVGQSYELVVPYDGDLDAAIAGFHAAHERRFGYSDPTERVQVVNVRVKARGVATPPRIARQPSGPPHPATPTLRRPVVFGDNGAATTHDTPVYDRATLGPGQYIDGPAIVTQYDTTLVVPPSWRATSDEVGNLVIEGMRDGDRS